MRPLFDQLWYMSVCRCVRITVSLVGPIARLSLSRGPVKGLRKMLCWAQRGRCSLASASCLRESCLGQGRGRWLGSGRTVPLQGPCCLELLCRLAAGPCTYERHCGKQRSNIHERSTTKTNHSVLCVSATINKAKADLVTFRRLQ